MKSRGFVLIFLIAAASLLALYFHKGIAKLLRKFWTKCPRCGRMFGGHQRHAKTILLEKNYRVVCGRCAKVKI